MKKRPQQCQRQGKSNSSIKSFINNLKENDLHFEDSQITQCVFLGVLRLKPVPSVFSSNNVPCVAVENKHKKIKNNNNTKEVNKNVTRRRDINKVISGRIGKKNIDKIRASIKKEPLKKPVIKLKFNMNKKHTSSKDSLESVRILPESLNKTSESVFTNRTITLNPITTVSTFNPVQNLFDKLKQQLDDSLNRPSSSEISKQTLFSDKSNTGSQLSSKKQKKVINKTMTSSVNAFSDNGYSSSSINSKSEDVFLVNEENVSDDCEVLLNTGPMPSFVFDTSKQKIDNDVILITDDNSDMSCGSRELIVVDDVRSIRSSPRLNKHEQRNIQQKIALVPETVITLDDGESSDKEKMSSKSSTEKPRKRRTLMPTAIPSIFFNTPRLLRSELGQKKGSCPETKQASKTTTKVQKAENKQDKLAAKQRKDPKLKNSTENIIYEVVKSTENIKLSAEIVTKPQDDVVLVNSSPPKVEPLILKLKKSTEKSANQNPVDDIRNKEKVQKFGTKNVTRNLFFPRLLRSDINQSKDSKLDSSRKSTKATDKDTQKINQLRDEKDIPSTSIGRLTVKPVAELLEKVREPENNWKDTTTQKVTEKNIEDRSTIKKNDKPLSKPSRIEPQEQNDSHIITINDSDSPVTTVKESFSQNSRKNKHDPMASDLRNQRNLRADESQNKGNESLIDKSKKNISATTTNTDPIEIVDIELQSNIKKTPNKRSELKDVSFAKHNKANNSEPIDVEEFNKTDGTPKKHCFKTGNKDGEAVSVCSLKSKKETNGLGSIDIDKSSKVEGTPTATKIKNIAVVQPMSRQSRVDSPQKKISEAESVSNTQNQHTTSFDKSIKVPRKQIVTTYSVHTEVQSQHTQENTISAETVDVSKFYSNDATLPTSSLLQERRQLRSDDTVDKNYTADNSDIHKSKIDSPKLNKIEKPIRKECNKAEKTKISTNINKDKQLETGILQKQIDNATLIPSDQPELKILRSTTTHMISNNSPNQVRESKVKTIAEENSNNKSLEFDRKIQQEHNPEIKQKIILKSDITTNNSKETSKKYVKRILKYKRKSANVQKVITKNSMKKPSKSITFKTITTEISDTDDCTKQEISKSNSVCTSKKPTVKKIVQKLKNFTSKESFLKTKTILAQKKSRKLKKKQTADSQIINQANLIVHSSRTPPKVTPEVSDNSQDTKKLENVQKETNEKKVSNLQSDLVLNAKKHLKLPDFTSETSMEKNIQKIIASKSENAETTPTSDISVKHLEKVDASNSVEIKKDTYVPISVNNSTTETKPEDEKSCMKKQDTMKQKRKFKTKFSRNLLYPIKKSSKIVNREFKNVKSSLTDLQNISQSNILSNSRRSNSKTKVPGGTRETINTTLVDCKTLEKYQLLKKNKLITRKILGTKIAANIKKASRQLLQKHNIEMKRKRGRPRKYPLKVKLEEVTNVTSSKEEVISNTTDNPILNVTGEIKKKCGRPRKQQTEAVLSEGQLTVIKERNLKINPDSKQVSEIEEKMQEILSTRQIKEEIGNNKHETSQLNETFVNKSRGRPKKQHLNLSLEGTQVCLVEREKETTENESKSRQAHEIDSIKKKRGRPKIQQSNVSLIEDKEASKVENIDNCEIVHLTEIGDKKKPTGRSKKLSLDVLKQTAVTEVLKEEHTDNEAKEELDQSVSIEAHETTPIKVLGIENRNVHLCESDTVKRKRGRPKKQTDITLDNTHIDMTNVKRIDTLADSVEIPVVTIKQGQINTVNDTVVGTEIPQHQIQVLETPNNENEIKRKRGRPKKLQVGSSKEEHTNPEIQSGELIIDDKNEVIQLIESAKVMKSIKLKQQKAETVRVVKQNIREEEVVDINNQNQTTLCPSDGITQPEGVIQQQISVDKQKKKVGRPRKQTEIPLHNELKDSKCNKNEENIVVQLNNGNQIKKKRGRPSKVTSELKLDLTEVDQEQKTKKLKVSETEIGDLQLDLTVNETNSDMNASTKKKIMQQQQQDLDVIMVLPEKRNKKQMTSPLKTLRSSINQVDKDRNLGISCPVVEKVVALIHSEPRPKQHYNGSENALYNSETAMTSKQRVLRSQNTNEIDSIHVMKEETKSKLAKGSKTGDKNKGVSEKSKNIIKSKLKKLKPIESTTKVANKKILKKDIIAKSKLKRMSNKSKQKVLKQIRQKLQNPKNKNILKSPGTKKSSLSKKRSVDRENNEIIERIIQEIRNTLFKESLVKKRKIKHKKITLKTQKKKNSKPERIKREAFLVAKKKMMQTKQALKQKLRNTKNEEINKNDEKNTSGESESKENHPPKKETEPTGEQEVIEASPEHNVMMKEEISVQSDMTNHETKTNKRKKELNASKRKSHRNTLVSRHMAAIFNNDYKDGENNDLKKNDITVFDFDEFEPEVTPLRTKVEPKLNETIINKDEKNKSSKEAKTSTPINSYTIYNSQKSSTCLKSVPATITKEVETIGNPDQSVNITKNNPSVLEGTSSSSQEYTSKIKILKQDRLFSEILVYSDDEEEEEEVPNKIENVEKETLVNTQKEYSSPENFEMPCQELVSKRRKLLIPYMDDHGKPRKLWSVIEPPVPTTPPRPITPRRTLTSPRHMHRSDSLEIFKPSTSGVKCSESDSPEEKKSPLKQPTIIEMFSKVWMKKEVPTKNLSEESNCNPEQSIFQRPSIPDVNLPAPSPRRYKGDDEDSDTESRAEWIPEEYAEYKFKYSASRMMQYKPTFKCKICMLVVPSYYKLLKHRKEHENIDKPYQCPHCPTTFSNVADFSAHLRLHKGKHPYMCPKCDLGFWTKSAYEAHQPVHILKKAKQPIKKFRCDVCAKEFSKLCDVERHTRVHTGEKPCICNICNKRFQQAHNLSKHLLTHLHIKPFYCEICNKQFGRNDVLRRHLLTHSIDKPIKCSVCHRGFIRQSQLLQHMRRKHPGHPVEDVNESYDDPNESESSETRDDSLDNQ